MPNLSNEILCKLEEYNFEDASIREDTKSLAEFLEREEKNYPKMFLGYVSAICEYSAKYLEPREYDSKYTSDDYPSLEEVLIHQISQCFSASEKFTAHEELCKLLKAVVITQETEMPLPGDQQQCLKGLGEVFEEVHRKNLYLSRSL